ncbi:hypothetical protein DFH08DRAFT_832933 [Mycena albidolilacea]|uniref:Uncharacterized protein n=1 Tax=Mycena albidolilacea TaxID=1033008 RepID=A0AAD7AVX3_9AGAR|nr:hypothetical protein DFH08DRAFT_832933 [Mycena albidolilacea]
MPPTLRSSPAGTRTTRSSPKVATPEKSSTPGKPRYCTSCKRPRKGHPREGCPFTEAPVQSDSPTRSVSRALDALSLAELDEDTTGTGDEGAREKKPRKPFTRMPGTLLTPAPSWMFSQSSQASTCKDETPPALDASFSSSTPYLGLSQTSEVAAFPPTETQRVTPPPATRPLTRTLTREERTAFTTFLTHLAKAAVYVLPTPDVPDICAAATERGLATRTLPLDHADTLLVVGHTAAAVEVLVYQVEAKMHALVPKPPPAGRAGALSTAAKAVVVGAVGAVAAWSALAFS